ncbi:MAG: Arc family DNA-binding protein [Clostridiales bacterium]|nr:Arc family DNA-binding protein [Clostridiales bacterium]
MEKSATFSIRIPHELKESLEKIASEDHRSLNNLINIILMKYVDEKTGGN